MEGTSLWSATRYDVLKVTRMRDNLVEQVFGDYLGARPEGEDFRELTRAVAAYLNIAPAIAFESMRTLAGQRLDMPLAGRTAWRLAGNLQRLRKDIVAPPWVFQYEKEAVPVQAMACTVQKTTKGQFFNVFTLRIMAGTPAAMVITGWWSRAFCYMLARRLGYTSRRGNFPFSHPTELVNMRMLVLLDPEKSRDGKPGFRDVRGSAGLNRWNRQIIEKRFRRQGKVAWPCPKGFDHYCFECRIGYVDCEAATHRLTKTAKQVQCELAAQAQA